MSGTVLQVILTKRLAGTERHVAELACSLEELGWRSVIVAPRDLEPRLEDLYARVAKLVKVPFISGPGAIPALANIARRHGCDVVHAHTGQGLIAASAARYLVGVPFIYTLHHIELAHNRRRGAWLLRWIYRRLTARAVMLIAISGPVQSSAVQRGLAPLSRVRVVPNGVGCVGSDGEPHAGHGRVVLFAGRLDVEKGLADLLWAAGSAPQPMELWIAGRGPDEPALRLQAETSAPGRYRFLGFRDDVEALMEQATVVAVPSLAEPFGLVAVEAMRGGRPVVGYAAGALPEIVQDGVTGRLVRPGDRAALRDALVGLLDDTTQAAVMGAAGRKRYEAEFTALRMAERTAALYVEARSHPGS